jgi:hypothetical protein
MDKTMDLKEKETLEEREKRLAEVYERLMTWRKEIDMQKGKSEHLGYDAFYSTRDNK